MTNAQPTPGTWTIDASHSNVGFTVRHLGFSKVRGGFNGFEGKITVADDLADSSVEVTIEAASFDSNDKNRDEHIRSADFLDAANFPTLTFVSTGVRHVEGNQYVITGDLTIRGTTKSVDLATEFVGEDTDPYGNTKAGFEATTEIDREDFGLTWNAPLESGGLLVAKRVTISLEVQAAKA